MDTQELSRLPDDVAAAIAAHDAADIRPPVDRTEPKPIAIDDAPIIVGGRTFRIAKSYTFESDLYTFRHIEATGVLQAFRDMATSPNVDRSRAQMLLDAYSSGHLFQLLAGVLREDGVAWTLAGAAELAGFFSQLTAAADKLALIDALTIAVASFFLGGGT